MREKVQVATLIPQVITDKDGNTSRLSDRGKRVYKALEPLDIVYRHSWLFENELVEPLADDLKKIDDMDPKVWPERIHQARIKALREIVKCRGSEGIFELAKVCKAVQIIGNLAACKVLGKSDIQQLLGLAFSGIKDESGHSAQCEKLARSIIRALPSNSAREESMKAAIQEHPEIEMVDVLLLSNY